MRYFHRPDCGIFCIMFVDIIYKSTMVLFSLLCVSYYHINMDPLNVEFINDTNRIVTYFRYTVNIAMVGYQNFSYLNYQKIQLKRYICCCFYWSTMILLYSTCCIFDCHGTFFSHKYQICPFVVFYVTMFSQKHSNE